MSIRRGPAAVIGQIGDVQTTVGVNPAGRLSRIFTSRKPEDLPVASFDLMPREQADSRSGVSPCTRQGGMPSPVLPPHSHVPSHLP